jgi:integrase
MQLFDQHWVGPEIGDLCRDGLEPPPEEVGQAQEFSPAVLEKLQDRLCRGTGLTTCNHYMTAMKGFTRSLSPGSKKRIPADPLADLMRQNGNTDERLPRRALPEDQFNGFVQATAEGKGFWRLPGTDRLVLCALAAYRGIRANELGSLTPASFALDTDLPSVAVQAGYSKHRRKDVQPLRVLVAEMMRQYLKGKSRHEPLWPGTWKTRASDMLRADLVAASIPCEDEDGRYFDFHGMHGQFISRLAARGVHPKVAQVLARHSTITLTMAYYTHLDVLDVRGALDKLPEVQGNESEAKSGRGVQGAWRQGSKRFMNKDLWYEATGIVLPCLRARILLGPLESLEVWSIAGK